MEQIVDLINSLHKSNSMNAIFFLLTFANTIYLLFSRFLDKPKLKSKPVSKHGNLMIWTIFPDTEYEGRNIRTYAFIPYMQVYNVGKRPVELKEWTLFIKDKKEKKYRELDISPIPLAMQTLGDGSAIKYNILGINDNVGAIQPGSSLSGFSLYVFRFYIDLPDVEGEGIIINKDDLVNGFFKIKDIYGKLNKEKVTFKIQSYEEVEKIMPGINESIYKER